MTEPRAEGSVANWLDGLRAGDPVAAQRLWDRYFTRLIALAEARLPKPSAPATGEDVALSALKSAMVGIQRDRFPDLADDSGLWPLLVTITARKAVSETRRQLAGKRSAPKTAPPVDVREVVGREPAPDFAAEVADELDRLLACFDNPSLRRFAQLKLEGATNEEIAHELSCSVRTVVRKLNLVRERWRHEAERYDEA